jgi:hypothetical protein
MAGSSELGFERLKRLGNLRTQLLKCFYDGHSIAECDINGKIALHVHGLAGNDSVCATWRYLKDSRSKDGLQVPVFVGVGDNSQQPRPLASVARLQLLNHCDVFVADTFEIARSSAFEGFFRVVDGKLCSILNLAGVEGGKLIDQVIKGGSQVIDRFTYQDAEHRREWPKLDREMAENSLHFAAILAPENSWLALDDSVITCFFSDTFNTALEIRQMCPTPLHALIRAIKPVHDVCPRSRPMTNRLGRQ